MNFLFANPSGLWALLAVPAILLIHFLQERSRQVRVSTLFLLERVKPESVGGARFERLRNSVPLWMQLLAALLLSWLLAEPRWVRQDSRQTVVVVLDSSISMAAFKEPTRALLGEKLRAWSHTAAATEWHLLESDTRQATLYAGSELALLLDAFEKWQPLQSTHRPDEALITA
ncbi:MAG: BatA domain-containing protein, partial [Roseimicrobium sp.]